MFTVSNRHESDSDEPKGVEKIVTIFGDRKTVTFANRKDPTHRKPKRDCKSQNYCQRFFVHQGFNDENKINVDSIQSRDAAGGGV